ncbi:GNAT family N-acetyltransferase [Chloroflexi bacterium TSY]|nr:GNAT family N-acetyltransferase [Chloroflexi bacterium TSY]
MSISYWDLDAAEALAECYNQQNSSLPYCYPVLPDDFAWNIQRGLPYFYGPSDDDLHAEKFIAWCEMRQVLSFAHVAIAQKKHESKSTRGLIKFLCYPPGYRAIGQALLDEAEGYFREKNLQTIEAFPKGHMYHFCSPDGGCSERHGHINALLGMNDCTISQRTVNMSWRDFVVSEPALPEKGVQINVSHPIEIGELPNIMIEARVTNGSQDTSALGECYAYSMGYLQRSEHAQDQIFINWLGVQRNFRGQGWGRYLLLRALWEAQKIGYKHTLLGTDERNSRAILLYANTGYKVEHSSYVFTKDLNTGG